MQQNGEKHFYLYNSSDMRIYKENQTESLQEFTLIDATGILGVKQISTDRWELYAGTGKNAYKYTELGSSTSSETYYIHDHLGNIRLSLTADMAGNHLQSALDYDPYGHLIRQYTASQPERYLTTGNERDQETQLDYRQARFYDSEIGRFLSVDPKWDVAPGWTPFRYGFDNPIKFNDPNGLLEAPIFVEDGNLLGVDSEGWTGDAIVMDKTKFKKGMLHKTALKNGTLLKELGTGIRISETDWKKIVANGGKKMTPYVINNSGSTVYYKPEGMQNGVDQNPGYSNSGAYPIGPNKDLYTPVDGIATHKYSNAVFKVLTETNNIRVNNAGDVFTNTSTLFVDGWIKKYGYFYLNGGLFTGRIAAGGWEDLYKMAKLIGLNRYE